MMKKGKIIVIEGTDCSGKETQSTRLVERLNQHGISAQLIGFPRYHTATGQIIGGPYLGKPAISECWFSGGSNSVDPRVASAYYAADRRAALPEINNILNSGAHLVLDRYVSANMGHQGGKIKDPEERLEFYKDLDTLEHEFMQLPRPDLTLFLYMPYEIGMEMKKGMNEAPDGHERDPNHLKNAEEAYLQLSEMNNWTRIDSEPFVNLESPETGISLASNVIFSKVINFLGKDKCSIVTNKII
jgi:dTMP kinase